VGAVVVALVGSVLVGSAVVPATPAFASTGAIVPGFNTTVFGPNDDGSYPCTGQGSGVPEGCTPSAISLPFSVNFFGTNYNQLYVNNNGNLTFGAPLATYTPYPLSDAGQPIIAPFFADVDTRTGNVVTFGTGSVNGHPAFGVNWPGVGCYSENTSVLDNFQVLLIDRSDIAPGDFDVEFNYGQIQWDSGQASGGNSSCQGGTAARAGYAGGSGATGTYYQIPGSGTDGAFLDSNHSTGLIYGEHGSSQPGRYIYQFRSGQATTTSGAPSTATGLGSARAARHNPTCSTIAPVNCASGEFWHTFTDANVPGPGPNLDLTRTYNSLDASTEGPFGYGWASSYDTHLTQNADGSVTITEGDGSQVTAVPAGGGAYVVPAWADSSLTQNPNGTWTFVRQQTQTFTFTASGALQSVSDPNGYTTTLSYNGSGQLTTVTDPVGRSLSYTYGANGLVASVTDPAGRTTHYSYSAAGDLTSVTNPAGGVTSFTYDTNHLLLTMTDPNGGTLSNVYDTSGRVISQTDPLGRTTTFSYSGDNYSADGGTTTITNPNGGVKIERYVSGELVQLTRGAGTSDQAVTTYTYDPSTLGRTSVTDPNGQTWSYTYDASGNLTSVTDPLSETTTTTYNNLDEPTSVTTPLGETTTYTYDTHGNLLSSTDPLGGTTSYTYGVSGLPGLVGSVTTPDGNTTTYTYDAYGDLDSQTTHPSASTADTTTYGYNIDGEQTCVVSPNAEASGATCPSGTNAPAPGVSTTTYNSLGEVVKTVGANGGTATYTYDADGNQTSVTDPNGATTVTTYDGDGRVLTVTRGSGATASTTKYAYDLSASTAPCSTVNSTLYCDTITNPNGGITVEHYNAVGNLVERVLPGGATTTYTYDGNNNLVAETQPDGTTTTYGYNADNKLTSISYSDGTTPNVTYTYNADGNRTSMTDGTGTTTYSYNADGNLTATTDGAGNTVSYTYDPAGNIIALTYPNGKTVTRSYNSAGQLASVTDWLGNTTTFSYDHDGNLTATTYPNGDTVRSSYDNSNQMTATAVVGAGNTTLAGITYTRDANGLVTHETDSGALSGSTAYTYDTQNRLTSAGTATYGYDPAGDLVNNAGTTQTFNSAQQLTTTTNAAGTTTYTYDPNGNLTTVATTGTTTSYGYNQANELISATQTSTTSGSGGGGGVPPAPPPPVPPPAVTSVTPATGPSTGGTTVTITGTNLENATAVTFGSHAATIHTDTDTAITATSPADHAGVVNIVVTTPSGASTTSTVAQFTYQPTAPPSSSPTVTRLAPNAGRTRGGNRVLVVGTGLDTVTAVTFGTAKATNLKHLSATKLLVTSPRHPAGTVNVILTGTGGQSPTGPTDHYTYDNPPVIHTIEPNHIPTAGKTTVTISGNNLAQVGAVFFGTTRATRIVYDSQNQLIVIAPPHPAGTVHIWLATPGGRDTPTRATLFTYTNRHPPQHALRHNQRDFAGINVAPHLLTPGDNVTYTYNGDGLRMSETTSSGTQTFAWDTTAAIPEVLNDGINNYIYGPNNQPIEQISTTGTGAYYFQDNLGSTRALLASNGSVAATFDYGAYGQLTHVAGGLDTPLRWAGAYQDSATGLYYMIHRYYEPATAQFTSVDPLLRLTGAAYEYGNDDPKNVSDLTGLCTFDCFVTPTFVAPTLPSWAFSIGLLDALLAPSPPSPPSPPCPPSSLSQQVLRVSPPFPNIGLDF